MLPSWLTGKSVAKLKEILGSGGGGGTQVQADWTETDTSDPSYIQNKPTLATVATSGDYDDLSNKPTIPAAQVQSDWSESDNTDPSYIQNKPTIPTGIPSGGTAGQVLTKESGTDYDAAWVTPSGGGGTQVQADWTETDTSDPSYIQNKPTLATVATSGDYDDLTNKPTIPAAQVQADWSESDTTDPSYIQNKPTIPTQTSQLTNNSNFIEGVITSAATLTAGTTSVTITDANIDANSNIFVLTAPATNFNSIAVAGTTVTVTFDSQQTDVSVKLLVL